MLSTADHTDVGVLIACALQPTLRPGRNQEYRRVLGRYRSEPAFRTATDGVLHGMGAKTLSDGDFGLILGVEQESPFAVRFADLPYTGQREGRLVAGLVMTGLAAWAFPNPAELEDQRPRRVPDVEFEAWLRAACDRLQVRDGAGEPIPDEGLDQSWRIYLAMPSTMAGEKGRGTRLSPRCTLYWVRSVLTWLESQGMARHAAADGAPGAGWMLTERFRINVKDMAAEPAYRFVAAIGRGEDPTAGMPRAEETGSGAADPGREPDELPDELPDEPDDELPGDDVAGEVAQ